MAKKFVRGITDVKTINNQDFDTNNVNDLLSDGEHNYIHRKKKDKSEEYHNLTNNIKTIKSDNTDLLTVTNYNNTTNSATLSPKHDKLKEQVIESTRNTIDIDYGENGTEETTKIDTNPQKVLEHENLITDEKSGISINHETSSETTNISLSSHFKLNNVQSITSRSKQITVNTQTGDYGGKAFLTLSPDFVNDVENLKTTAITNITSDTPLIEFTKDGNNVELNGTALVNNINAKQNKLTAGSGIIIQGSTISATGGLTPQHVSFGTRGQSYYAFREVFGQRTTYTIEVVQGEPELTVVGPLKESLAQELSTVKTVTNGAITLTYDDTNVKIITNTSPANGVEQATFTFFHQ